MNRVLGVQGTFDNLCRILLLYTFRSTVQRMKYVTRMFHGLRLDGHWPKRLGDVWNEVHVAFFDSPLQPSHFSL